MNSFRMCGWLGALTLALAAGSAEAATRTVGVGGQYATIGAAVVAANAGDTISVLPGLYQESLTIGKTLTLVGATISGDSANGGPTGRTGDTTKEAVVRPAVAGQAAFNLSADGISVTGFSFVKVAGDPIAPAIQTSGLNSGFNVSSCYFTGNSIGIYLNSNGTSPATIYRNSFAYNNDNAAGLVAGTYGGKAIYSHLGLSNITVSSCTFSHHASAAISVSPVDDAGGVSPASAVFSGLSIHHNTSDGDSNFTNIEGYQSVTIDHNTVTNTVTKYSNIYVGGGSSNVTVTANTLNGGARGIRLGACSGTIEVGGNTISNETEAAIKFDAAAGIPGASVDHNNCTMCGYGLLIMNGNSGISSMFNKFLNNTYFDAVDVGGGSLTIGAGDVWSNNNLATSLPAGLH